MEPQMEVDGSDPQAAEAPAVDVELPPSKPRRIRALDPDVVNKIAAGEIIVAPMHALKELIENSVDAGSTSVEILVKDGGLKLLQITDNGHGIDRDDLPMLCERFTTSKLQSFEDLTSIGTYGFRGEALASISHIAHLTVTTKTSGSSCAWRAHYGDGKLAPAKPGQSADPKATAGRGGTQITVEDLFYNIPTRRRAFRSTSEEYAKILDVVGRYAIHCSGVAFSCKKHGDSGTSISTSTNATTVDRIRQIHGSAVASELVDFEVDDEKWGFRASGWATNANYHVKRTTILLFINHRSVESSAVKRAVEQTYSTFLPKGGHPFIYIDLEIEPQRVDVNVHPTKREVNFLNEDEIIECICNKIKTILAKVDSSRTFMTQSLLPGTNTPGSNPDPNSGKFTAGDGGGTAPKTPATAKRPYENNLVRTDAKMRKITSMLQSTPSQRPEGTENDNNNTSTFDPETQYETNPDREPVQIRLTSIKNLRAAVRSSMHNTLTESLSSHTFVGLVDPQRRIAAIQSGVKLLLVDYGMLSNEYFYQVGLTDFGNFGSIKLDPPPKLTDLLTLAANVEREEHLARQSSQSQFQPDTDDNTDNDPIDFSLIPTTISTHLISRREMLLEYFSLEISEDGDLLSLPLLQRGYMPPLAKLPRFLMRLGPYVNWGQEEACFKGVLRELAGFYTPEQLPPQQASSLSSKEKGGDGGDGGEGDKGDGEEEGSDEDLTIQQRRRHLTYALEHVLFPAFRSRLIATDVLLKGVIEVADLKGLYRVFERC